MTNERNELVVAHISLAKKMTRWAIGHTQQIDSDAADMLGDAYLGLLSAAGRYDSDTGTPFDKYASNVIRGYLLNGIRSRHYLDDRNVTKLRAFGRFIGDESVRIGRMPTMAESEIAIPGIGYALRKKFELDAVSLESPTLFGRQPIGAYGVDNEVVESESRNELLIALRSMPERERTLLGLHYFEGETLAAVARRLSVSKQRVSQLHVRAIARLRKALWAA